MVFTSVVVAALALTAPVVRRTPVRSQARMACTCAFVSVVLHGHLMRCPRRVWRPPQ